MKKYIAIILTAIVTTVVATAALDTFRIANNKVFFGLNSTADKLITFNNNAGSGNPILAMKSGVLQFSNDGTTFFPLSAGIPTGAQVEWPVYAAPAGWVLEDGAAYSRTDPTYAALYALIGTMYGPGDATTTFNVPDARGAATRMFDDGTVNLDPDRATRIAWPGSQTTGTLTISGTTSSSSPNVTSVSSADMANVSVGKQVSGTLTGTRSVIAILSSTSFQLSNNSANTGSGNFLISKGVIGDFVGSYQADAFASHTHTITQSSGQFAGASPFTHFATDGSGAFGFVGSMTSDSSGGNETRIKNLYVMKIIKL